MKNNHEQSTIRRNTVSRRASQNRGWAGVLGGVLLLALLGQPGQSFAATNPAGQTVNLAWNPDTSPNVVGCDLYYGGASGTYTNLINAGTQASAKVSGLVAGVTYYFAVKAYNAAGAQSAYSTEVRYTVPVPATAPVTGPVTMQLGTAAHGQFLLTLNGPSGATYKVEATQDLKVWTVIGTVTLGGKGSSSFTDTNTTQFAQRFYRTAQMQ